MLAPPGRVPGIASAGARRPGPAWPDIQPCYHRWRVTPASPTLGSAGTGLGYPELSVDEPHQGGRTDSPQWS